jgi:DNA-binding LytR/AlgR family response regulator
MAILTVLIDDNKENINRLSKLIDNIYDVEIIAHFDSAEKFLKAIKSLRFDLCIVDYHLPNMSGIACVERIPNKHVILTSHTSIPAHEAMTLEDITDVILLDDKLTLGRLEKSIKRVRDKVTSQRGYTTIKSTPNNHRQVNIDDIVYIRNHDKMPKHKVVVTPHEEIVTQQYTMQQLLKKLPDELFVQVNENNIIHVNSFHSLGAEDEIFIQTPWLKKKLLPITLTRTYKKRFDNLLNIN